MAFDPPGRRIERLEEGVQVFKRLCGGHPVHHDGPAYAAQVEAPQPTVQTPHPPILIGGGGQRILELAAREADIVGVHARLPVEGVTAEAAHDLGPGEMEKKVAWVRSAVAAAGRPADSIELQVNVYLCEVGDVPRLGNSRWTTLLADDPTLLRESPAVLIGSVTACAELLEERRERYGFSYIRLGGAPSSVAPLVARLTGR
jgi:alkanesulfonate monooxygenase SsuD/methylene tetrahydromethanopterin reductase-like flavin-dependent oxidoreductase (luciferase family)